MRKLLLSLAMIPVAVSTASADFVGNGAGFNIPDNDLVGASSSINVALGPNEVISDVTVTLNGASHDWVGDLTATLSGPGGSIILFSNTNNDDSSDLAGDYTFTDAGPGDWWAAADVVNFSQPIAPGSYFPTNAAGALTSFGGTFGGSLTNGLWTLTIVDDAAEGTGSITGWQLNITSAPAGIPEPTTLGLIGLAGLGMTFWRRRR